VNWLTRPAPFEGLAFKGFFLVREFKLFNNSPIAALKLIIYVCFYIKYHK